MTDLALLQHHGHLDVVPGTVDLAVNVRAGGTPPWLRRKLARVDLAGYPDQADAVAAVASRHGRPPSQVLLTAGAAEAFVLIARALTPRTPLVVHPQFTEPELALRSAGHAVERLVLSWPYTLDATLVRDDADLLVIGNPTNPTSVAHPRATLLALARPGRVVVVDEAFADCVPGEPDSLADEQLEGVIVVRSLTKTWGLAGLRVGYVLAEEELIDRLRAVQPAWPVSTPALAACVACSRPDALDEARRWATEIERVRTGLVARLRAIGGVDVVPDPAASFVLVRAGGRPGLRTALLKHGFAARRGDTFPGLGPDWFRIAVRDDATSNAFVLALQEVLAR